MQIPKSHPRYNSLIQRERLLNLYENGIVTISGLISHGRGEAFDYLLGEKSQDFAIYAEKAALSRILASKNPVISVNGNVTALADDAIVEFALKYSIKVEVNLFHWSEERISKIVEHFKNKGLNILGRNQTERILGIEHDRGRCEKEGIFSADTVVIPLEDGDRAEALRKMGKFIIAIDLNPLSRTAKAGDITIVDDVKRTFENLAKFAEDDVTNDFKEFDNRSNLKASLFFIADRLKNLEWSVD